MTKLILCRECLYWQAHINANPQFSGLSGDCMRRPPEVFFHPAALRDEQYPQNHRPVTYPADWCSEAVAK